MAEIGFCIDSVMINDERYIESISSSAFEVEFDDSLKIGSPLKVEVYHKNGCRPKLLSVQGTRNFSKIEFQNMELSDSLVLSAYVVTPYKIRMFAEQHRWDKWIKIESTECYVDSGFVSFDLSKEKHAGKNEYRLVFSDPFSRKTFSNALIYLNKEPNFDYHHLSAERKITFDQWTRFEFYDTYGNIVAKGQGD